MLRGAVADIDLDAVAHNLGIIRQITGNRPVIAVVKADAYGHGTVEVSKILEREGVSILAVAFTEEAVKLREAGVSSPILVLFDKEISAVFEYDLIPVVYDTRTAQKLSQEAGKRGRPVTVHIKVDTGMGRVGFHSGNLIDEILAIAKMEHIRIGGLMSHFSNSDVADKSHADSQLNRFTAARDALLKTLVNTGNPPLCHMANSAATMSLNAAHMDAVRPGLMLYGCSPFQPSAISNLPSASRSSVIARDEIPKQSQGQRDCRASLAMTNPVSIHGSRANELKPAMTVKTGILVLKRVSQGTPVSYGGTFITKSESLIAILPIGYADGYSRTFSNNAEVLVRGKRVPVIGRVCMDLTMIDVTQIEDVSENDEVILLGRQRDEEITASELAMKAGTIPYEILTSLGSRSRRVYKG